MEEAQYEEVIRCCGKIISANIKYLFLLLDLLSVLCHVLNQIDEVETGYVRNIRKHKMQTGNS